MTRPVIPIGRFIGATALAAAPAALIFLALAWLGRLDLGLAVVAIVLSTTATAAIVAHYYREAARIADYLARLGRSEEEPPRPPRPSTDLGRAVVGTVSRLQRGWRSRSRRMTARLAEASAVLEALHDPLVVIDGRRRVVRANDAALTLFDAAMVGRDLAERLRHPAVLDAVDGVLADGGARVVELTQPVPVERVFEVRVVRFERDEADGTGPAEGEMSAPGALVTFHDVTTIRRSEQMRADFVANASHELRTPLSALTGFIETLRGPARDDPAARDRFLSIMHDQTARMSRLVADLLSLSRIEVDEHTPPLGTVDLVRVLRGVMATLEIKAARRDLTLRLEAPEASPVTGDEDQLTQVFQNLIDNAIAYTRPATGVVVSVAAAEAGPGLRGPSVAVAVRDRGEGIGKAHLSRLTERFYRVDAARSRAVGGTGLGLAIVKHIVSRHRGRLLIESEPGEGSTFTVILPTADPARGPRDRAKTASPVTKP